MRYGQDDTAAEKDEACEKSDGFAYARRPSGFGVKDFLHVAEGYQSAPQTP